MGSQALSSLNFGYLKGEFVHGVRIKRFIRNYAHISSTWGLKRGIASMLVCKHKKVKTQYTIKWGSKVVTEKK